MCFDWLKPWLNWLKSVLPCITVLLRWLKTIFSLEEVIPTCKFCLLQLLGHICVDIQCGRNICVSQGILNDLDIYACRDFFSLLSDYPHISPHLVGIEKGQNESLVKRIFVFRAMYAIYRHFVVHSENH